MIPHGASILDIGCGDGLLAKQLTERVPGTTITGVDVLVRPNTHIPVHSFDGSRIPFDDNSFDIVLMVDVLHHAGDPRKLLRETKRVARRHIIIKDHTREGILAHATLASMDWVGNIHQGVQLTYNYWSRKEWDDAFRDNHMAVARWHSKLRLYPVPADWWFGRSLHFVAMLCV